MDQGQYSLRERKYAKNRIALARAFIERLRKNRYEEISITDLCADVDISEGTFFNYFPRKIDVIHYLGAMFGIQVIWKTYQKANKKSCLSLIDTAFDNLAEDFTDPNVVYDIMSTVIGQRQAPVVIKITRAEKHFAYPDCAGIEDIEPPAVLFERFFDEIVKKAVTKGELPAKTNIREAVLLLKIIMVGVPLAINRDNIEELKAENRKMLKLVWKALDRKDYRRDS